MGMSSVKQGMWFGWNVKNFAQNLLIIPGSTWRGQSTVNSERICREVEICRWGGEGRGVDQQSTQRGSAERLKIVGWEGGEERGVN